jgi:hypothetical protein
MKLSAAIRIGSMTTKQIKGNFTDGGNGRCALGAAIDATGVKVKYGADAISQLHELFPQYPTELLIAVWLRNDGVNEFAAKPWTREQIADWVELQEAEHDGYITTGVTESKPLELIAREGK